MADYNIVVKENPLSRLIAELPQLLMNFQLRQQEMNLEADREAQRYVFEREMADAQRTHEKAMLDDRFDHEASQLTTKLDAEETLLDKKLTSATEDLETRLDAESDLLDRRLKASSTDLQTQIDAKFDLLEKELDFKEDEARIERELRAETDHYNDAKRAYDQVELLLDEKEAAWQQTGMSLDGLYGEDITSSSLELAELFSTFEADQYKEKGDYYDQLAEVSKDKIDHINELLSGVIRKGALFVEAGGDRGKGYGDPLMWDIEDLGYDAFAEQYPDLSDTEKRIAREWYEANAPVVSAKVRDMQTGELSKAKIEATTNYYENQAAENKLKNEKAGAIDFFNRRLNKIKISVNFDGIAGLKQQILDPASYNIDTTTDAGKKKYDSINLALNKAEAQIALDFSYLIGEASAGEAQPDVYLEKFRSMYESARGQYASPTALVAGGDYADFNYYLDLAYEHYKGADTSNLTKIERLAKVYFGIPENMDFKDFVTYSKMYYNASIFGDFESADQIEDLSKIIGDEGRENPEQTLIDEFNQLESDKKNLENLITDPKLLEEIRQVLEEGEE